MADNIVIWICAGAKAEDCDALFREIDKECEKRHTKAEIVFENPAVYKGDNNLRNEYSKVKSREEFFKYSCSEVCSGSMWKEISQNFDENFNDNKHSVREIYLFGIFKEMSENILNGYRYGGAGYRINVFMKDTNSFEPFNENIKHGQFPETGHVELSIDENFAVKKIISSKEKKIRICKIIAAVIAIVIITAGVAVGVKYGLKYFSDKKNKEESSAAVSEEAEKEKTTVSEAEIKEQLEKIYTDYLEKSVHIDKKNAADKEEENYNSAIEKLEKFSDENSGYTDDVSDVESRINALYVDRINYIQGMQAVENLIAIEALGKVTDSDSEIYEKSQEKIALLIEAEKDNADKLAANKDFRGACEVLDTLDRNISNDKTETEIKGLKEGYIRSWIQFRKDNNCYFDEDGALRIAHEYNILTEEEMNSLLEEGYIQTRKKLFDWINEQRVADPYSYEPLKVNEEFEEDAQRYAKILFNDGSIDEKRNLYNINDFGRNDEFTSDFAAYYGERFAEGKDKGKFINGVGEFVADSKDIGIGLYFDTESNICVFVVITSSGEENKEPVPEKADT